MEGGEDVPEILVGEEEDSEIREGDSSVVINQQLDEQRQKVAKAKKSLTE